MIAMQTNRTVVDDTVTAESSDTEVIYVGVAATIRAEMARKLVTSKDLAIALNVSRTAVYRRIHGEVPFSVTQLRVVADLVGRPISYLLGEEPIPA